MRKTAWMLAGVLVALPLTHTAVAAESDGLRAGTNPMPWARWQGRLSLVTSTDPWRLGVEGPAVKISSARLMGDYYFARSLTGLDRPGGLRATSGLIFGPRSVALAGQPAPTGGSAFSIGNRSIGRSAAPYPGDPAGDTATLPYLGIGYTGLAPRSGWGFSADLGLIARSPNNSPRIGGSPSLDDLIRDMRMTPLLQFGVSYPF